MKLPQIEKAALALSDMANLDLNEARTIVHQTSQFLVLRNNSKPNDQPLELTTKKQDGSVEHKSFKHIFEIDMDKFLRLTSSGVLGVAGIVADPWLSVFSAILLWKELGDFATAAVSKNAAEALSAFLSPSGEFQPQKLVNILERFPDKDKRAKVSEGTKQLLELGILEVKGDYFFLSDILVIE